MTDTTDDTTDDAAGETTEAAIDAVQELVEGVADALGIDEDVTADLRGEELHIVVQGDDLGLLIGRHGQTLEALQHLAQRVALDHGLQSRVIVDAEGYRARRQEAIEAQVRRLVERTLADGNAAPLESMTSSERRFVHEMVRDIEGVESYSEGVEPDRHAVIVPEGQVPEGAGQ